MEQVEQEVNKLITEYLTSKGYLQTVATLETECKHRKTPSTSVGSTDIQSEMLVAFECGEQGVFFSLWEEHIPRQLRMSDSTTQSLECNISAYFAVFPIRTGSGNKEQSMSEFRSYLEKRGNELAQSQELATYFALPYVPDPSKHPTFKNLFLDSWNVELKGRVVQFLEMNLPLKKEIPSLITMYMDSKKTGGILLQEDCVTRLAEVQASYHTLVGIAMELVGALESAVAGKLITPEFIHGICTKLFENSPDMTQPVEMPRPSTSTSVLRASIMSLRQSVQVLPAGESEEMYPPLDFDKIKFDLIESNDSKKIQLIRALRWRLTRSLPGSQRSAVISSFLTNDLLGCSEATGSDLQTSILNLLKTSSPLVKEQMARLFNSLSSLADGRRYLAQSTDLVETLLLLMYNEEHEDTPTRKNALGAVQKLSLRRTISRMMIRHSIVQWVVDNVLTQQDSLSDYTVRYSLALLMNISLRSIGKSQCSSHAEKLLKVLSEMLEHEDQEIRSYVNGTLYSLLTSPSLRDEARKMGMDEMLQSALRSSPPDLQSQIKYIITQLNADSSDVVNDSGDEMEEEEDEEDPDLIEGDEEEIATDNDNGMMGETLLIRHYSLNKVTPPPAKNSDEDLLHSTQPIKTPSSSFDQFPATGHGGMVQDTPYMRPVTPQSYRPVTPLSYRPHTAASQQELPPPVGSKVNSQRLISTAD